jgi:hypothetical protein
VARQAGIGHHDVIVGSAGETAQTPPGGRAAPLLRPAPFALGAPPAGTALNPAVVPSPRRPEAGRRREGPAERC